MISTRGLVVAWGLTALSTLGSAWSQVVEVLDEKCVRHSVVRCSLDADGLTFDTREVLMYQDGKVPKLRDNPYQHGLLEAELDRYWDGLDGVVGLPGPMTDEKVHTLSSNMLHMQLCRARALLDARCTKAVDFGATTKAVESLKRDLADLNGIMGRSLDLLEKTVKQQSELIKTQTDLIETLKKKPNN